MSGVQDFYDRLGAEVLSEEVEAEVRETNPHLRQPSDRVRRIDAAKLPRQLRDDLPRLKYRRRRGEVKTVCHWGQRKLLLSEIEFLTTFHQQALTCIYAGAAPGTHIPYLSSLFPTLRFILYDPGQFNIQSYGRVEVHQEFFTESIAAAHAGDGVLFISDIRTADWKIMSPEEVEEAVAKDQEQQAQWVRRLCPVASLLKFRLPWRPGRTKYLEGTIDLPVWGPQTTTECRLVVKGNGAKMKEYDHKAYEERLFFFNTSLRIQCFTHKVKGRGIDYCYDCAAEVAILRSYLTSVRGRREDEESVDEEIGRMSEDISSACSPHSGRSLATVLPAPEKRKPWFKARVYDAEEGQIVEFTPPPVAIEGPRVTGEERRSGHGRDEAAGEEKRGSDGFEKGNAGEEARQGSLSADQDGGGKRRRVESDSSSIESRHLSFLAAWTKATGQRPCPLPLHLQRLLSRLSDNELWSPPVQEEGDVDTLSDHDLISWVPDGCEVAVLVTGREVWAVLRNGKTSVEPGHRFTALKVKESRREMEDLVCDGVLVLDTDDRIPALVLRDVLLHRGEVITTMRLHQRLETMHDAVLPELRRRWHSASPSTSSSSSSSSSVDVKIPRLGGMSYIYGSHLQHWSKLRLSIPHRILGVRWNHKNAVRSTSSFVVEEEKFQEAFGSALSSD